MAFDIHPRDWPWVGRWVEYIGRRKESVRAARESQRLDITRWLLSPRQRTTHKRTTTSTTKYERSNRLLIEMIQSLLT